MTSSDPLLWWSAAALANHLWQSTLVTTAAALLILAFRRDRAEVRYWIWLAASLKFLIPFEPLVALGRMLGVLSARPVATVAIGEWIDGMSRPFSRSGVDGATAAIAAPAAGDAWMNAAALLLTGVWLTGVVVGGYVWAMRWRRTAALVRRARPIESGREVDMLRALELTYEIHQRVELAAADTIAEPGVFGIFRPVLLWPHRLGERLDDRHIAAILAHELSHVRRRDNLTAALHTLAQTLFWFHPALWLTSGRLVDERERACDEAALRMGSDPKVYAESILRTCRFSLGLPPALVMGAGSNLTERIEAIMGNRTGQSLGRGKRILLAAAVSAAAVVPIAAGALQDPAPQTAQPSPEIHAAIQQLQEPLGRVVGGRYEHRRTGITFDVPAGWSVFDTIPSSDNGEQVLLQTDDPPATLSVWMVAEPVAPENIGPWLDGAPQQKYEQRNGGYAIPGALGYRIREGSVYRTMFGSHHGIVAIGEYHQGPSLTPQAEYMTWIYTEKGRTFFFARVAADDLERLKPQFEQLVISAVIP